MITEFSKLTPTATLMFTPKLASRGTSKIGPPAPVKEQMAAVITPIRTTMILFSKRFDLLTLMFDS
ncbi:hypothetical protein AMI01nite_38380 [Aneurinibacillus migulanus]|nr:hypothetical protein AMI01nite_38380 [Aneurinibacillus migulanus]